MNRYLYCLYCIVIFIGLPYTPKAQIISSIAGNGTVGYSGDGGDATLARLDSPTSLAIDGLGNVYVNDQRNHCVRKINTSGVISTIAGIGSGGFSGDGGVGYSARLNGNWGIAADNAGNIYITDQYNYRVRKVNTSGIITTIAGNGVNGFSGDGGSSLSASFRKPLGIAIDNAGNIFVGDADNYRVRKIDAGGVISTYAGTGVGGYSGDGGMATAAKLGYIWGLSTDLSGNLYICDGTNNRVRMVTPSGTISTIAGTGAAGYAGDGGPAVNASLNQPLGVYAATSGEIYISDCQNNRVRMIGTDGIITTIAGTGVAGYNGDGIPATTAMLYRPIGIVLDANENVYVSDLRNVRVRKINNVLAFVEGDTASIGVCQNSVPVSVDDVLSVRDIYVGLLDEWSIVTPAVHGTALVSYSASSSGGIITPIGLTYEVDLGYTGRDSFEVKVVNSLSSDLIKIYVNVAPLLSPGVITGGEEVCISDTIDLVSTQAGGEWDSENGLVGVLENSDGCKIYGLNAGVDTIRYTVSNACGASFTTKSVTVNPLPDPGYIAGPEKFCIGATVNFSATIAGGVWSTSNANTNVNILGQVKGITQGESAVLYTVSNAVCQAVAIKLVFVETFPSAGIISGPVNVCLGSEIELVSTIGGGVWSSNFGYASVSLGKVKGEAVGNDFINYSISNTCGVDVASRPVAVNQVPEQPIISESLGLLFATKGYYRYQWLLDSVEIFGAVADTFHALSAGVYFVVVSNAYGCSNASPLLNYQGCSPDDIEVLPNPVSGELTITWCKPVTAIVQTIDGKLVSISENVKKITLKTLPAGTYILGICDTMGNRIRSMKIVKLR